MEISDALACFLAAPAGKPSLTAISDREQLREASHEMVRDMLQACSAHEVLPPETLLALFVHVLPDDLDIDFQINGIVRGSRKEELKSAARSHADYVQASRASIFRWVLGRRTERGWVGVFSHTACKRPPASGYDLVASEGSRAPRYRSPSGGPFEAFCVDAGLPAATHVSPSVQIEPHVDLVRLFSSKRNPTDEAERMAVEYVQHITPLCDIGDVVVVAPRLHLNMEGPSLGGGGMMFILDAQGTTKDVIDQLYLVAHRVVASTVEHLNIAHFASRKEQLRASLFTFGHHLGGLFQESGLLGLQLPENPEFDRMRSRLLHAWGIGEAMRALKYEGSGFPADWFDRKHAEPQTLRTDSLVSSLEETCRFLLAGRTSNLPATWTARWSAPDRSKEVVSFDRLASSAPKVLPSLPPFPWQVDHPASLALTLGLAELIRNILSHYASADFQLAVHHEDIPSEVLELSFSVDEDKATIVITSVYGGSWDSPFSKAVQHIQVLEREALSIDGRPVVETSQFSKSEDLNFDNCRIMARWRYWHSRVRAANESEPHGAPS